MSDEPLANDPRLLPPNRFSPEVWTRARELARDTTHESLTREDIATLIWAEYLYWYDADIDHPASTFAIGPVANLTGALVMGRPPSDLTEPAAPVKTESETCECWPACQMRREPSRKYCRDCSEVRCVPKHQEF